jgi:Major Facilitator Superfamily
MSTHRTSARFHGWTVVAGAFVLAAFGWGLGFYGPPVYLHAVQEARGWPLPLVASAVTVHFLVGTVLAANLPALYARFGLPSVVKAGVVALAAGVWGWAVAREPWQLFAATLLSGTGWVVMGSTTINAIVSPWFARQRPVALSMAFNGASFGGVIFSPLWVVAIERLGFSLAAAAIGGFIAVATWILADRVFSRRPEQMGLAPDGEPGHAAPPAAAGAHHLPGASLWRDMRFVTLVAGTALGLFAQIGLIAHLFSLMVPALGPQLAGWAMGLATAAAIGGRTVVGWLMPANADRRHVACAGYAIQILGSLAFLAAGGNSIPLLLVGVVLFGSGIGNAVSVPPLIAQSEFAAADVQRVVALTVAIGQTGYAFAPAVFGVVRELPPLSESIPGGAPLMFAACAIVQGLAVATLYAGRWGLRRKRAEFA